ncbi:MAG TPA: helix-turn-helix domain-containing protein, partial [Candidatus Saccharimonadales bacterium]|nr:helix-turn-helix domain-containing protein [Candidatus Saccharimonadales bacterium]
EEGGLAALGRTGGYPLGRTRVAAAREQLIQRLKAQGVGQREIARRMGCAPSGASSSSVKS